MLGIYEVGLEYQPQFWSFNEESGTIVFTSLGTPPGLVARLSGDWIKEYFKGKEALFAQADDEDQDSSYQLAGDGITSGGGGNSPSTPSSPKPPGSPGKTPDKPKPGKRPPGPMTP